MAAMTTVSGLERSNEDVSEKKTVHRNGPIDQAAGPW